MKKTSRNQCAGCRRAGTKLFLKGEKCFSAKCPMLKRNFPPGQHGSKRRSKMTSYGEQLKEKQNAKRIYGLRERQFRKYVDQATKQKGNTAETLLDLLERRLDNVVYRLGLGKTREMARQIVSHAHFLVDGKKVNIPSFQVKPGQVVSLSEKARKKKIFENLPESLAKHEAPEWLHLDAKNLSGKVAANPKPEEIRVSFNPRKIIEFYSR